MAPRKPKRRRKKPSSKRIAAKPQRTRAWTGNRLLARAPATPLGFDPDRTLDRLRTMQPSDPD